MNQDTRKLVELVLEVLPPRDSTRILINLVQHLFVDIDGLKARLSELECRKK
jgi:hypothetical protein